MRVPDRFHHLARRLPPAAASWRAPRLPGYDASAAETLTRALPMLESAHTVWLSTVGGDHAPHLVPTWFLWDGEALLVFSRPGAVKVRNLRRHPRLMIALGEPDQDFAVSLIEARATLLPGPAQVPDAFFAKYRRPLAATGLDDETYRRTFTQAIRIVPTRYLAWHGRSESRERDRRNTTLLPAWA